MQRVFPPGGTAATNGGTKLKISALSEGDWGNNIAVKIELNKAQTAFDLTVMYWTVFPDPFHDPTSSNIDERRKATQPQIIEVFSDLVADKSASNFSELQINELSNLIVVEQLTPDLPEEMTTPTQLQGGADGNNGELKLEYFKGDPEAGPGEKTGLDAFTEIDDISLLSCPDTYALDPTPNDISKAINQEIINQCEILKDRFAVLGSARQEKDKPGTLSIDFNSKYAAFYYPWIKVIDPVSGQPVLVPPAGHVEFTRVAMNGSEFTKTLRTK